jgi:hypothetical protein
MCTEDDERIVRLLDQLDPPVSGAASAQPPIAFNGKTWREWTTGTPAEKVTRELTEQFAGGTISRADLRVLSDKTDDSFESQLRLLVATLMWGRGKRNGRMRNAIQGTLSNKRLAATLKASRGAARASQPKDAYEAWGLPSGIRAAFFTKWLWSAGCTGESLVLRPLILDARVSASLRELGWDGRRCAGSIRLGARYEAYVKACHRWASALSTSRRPVTAEDIEATLFKYNGRFPPAT